MRWATRSAARDPVRGKSTTNSSPPKRPTRSVGRIACLSALPTVASAWSPARWPATSLMRFIPSMSIIRTLSGAAARRAAFASRTSQSSRNLRVWAPVSGSSAAIS